MAVSSTSGGIESPAIIFTLPHHHCRWCCRTIWPLRDAGAGDCKVALLSTGFLHVRPSSYGYDHLAWVAASCLSRPRRMPWLTLDGNPRRLWRETELAGLYQSARLTSSTLDLQLVLNRLTEATVKALGCRGASIRLLDKTGSHLEMASTYGLSDAYVGIGPIDPGRALIDREVLSGVTVLVEDAPNDPRIHPDAMRREAFGPSPVPRSSVSASYRRHPAYGGEAIAS
jgi:hypothetical protein